MRYNPGPVTIAEAIRWWMWVGAGALLVIAKILPTALPRRMLAAVVLGALGLAAWALFTVVDVLGRNPDVERGVTLDALIAKVSSEYQSGRESVLLIGSSRSTLGLDGEALERALGVEILQFSATGHYALEQTHTTRKLLERMQPGPLMVLIELGTELYLGLPDFATYTARGIEFFDRHVFWLDVRLWRAARAGDTDAPAYSFRSLLRAAAHTALHHLGIGLLLDLEDPQPTAKVLSFAPAEARPAQVPRESIVEALATDAATTSVPTDRTMLVAMSRAELIADIERRVSGEVKFLFFVPPTADPALRAAAPSTCAAVASVGACVHMTDAEVRTLLPEPVWFDRYHLLRPGAATFTRWLGDQLRPLLRGP